MDGFQKVLRVISEFVEFLKICLRLLKFSFSCFFLRYFGVFCQIISGCLKDHLTTPKRLVHGGYSMLWLNGTPGIGDLVITVIFHFHEIILPSGWKEGVAIMLEDFRCFA